MRHNRLSPLRTVVLVLTACAAQIAAASAQLVPNQGVAPVKPVVDTYVGHTVTDPYQWMENLSDPATVSWLKNQSSYTNNFLAAIPHHADLLARIHSLDGSVTTYSVVNHIGNRLFYEKLRPTDQTPMPASAKPTPE